MARKSTKKRADHAPTQPDPRDSEWSERALKRLRTGLVLALLAAVWLAYATSFSGTFVFDDENQILMNPDVTQSTLGELLTGSTRPVTDLTLKMDWHLGGGPGLTSPDERPSATPFHVTNLAIHSLAALTLFALIAGTLRLPRFDEKLTRQRALSIAFAVACLWAVHPLTTQSVTYIVQRAEAMMGLFYLLTLYTLLRTARSEGAVSGGWAVLCVGACALGMGSKAVMLTAPLAALAYDHTFLARHALDALKKRWPLYVGLACTWSILSVTGIIRGVFNPHPNADPTVGFTVETYTPLEYFFTQPSVILHYLRLSIAPVGLTLDYKWPAEDSVAVIAVTTLIVGALGVLTLHQLWKRTWLGFAGAFFFIVLSTTSSFIPINDIAFEHRMYLPLISVVLITSVLIWKGLTRLTTAPANLASLLFLIAAIALASLTGARNLDYASGVAIWADTYHKAPENPRAASNYASMLARIERYVDALPVYERSLELEPNDPDTHAKYARALSELGQHESAIEHFERALELDPTRAMARADLVVEYATLERWADVIPLAREALEDDPDDFRVLSRLTTALLETEQYVPAERRARQLVEQLPDSASAYKLLAKSLRGQYRLEHSLEYYEKTLELDPSDIPAAIEMANVYEERGNLAEAFTTLYEMSQIRFENPDPHTQAILYYNLGNTTYRYRVSQEDPREDIFAEIRTYYERAIDLNPNYANAHFALGWVHEMTGHPELARRYYSEALRIDPGHAQARRAISTLGGG